MPYAVEQVLVGVTFDNPNGENRQAILRRLQKVYDQEMEVAHFSESVWSSIELQAVREPRNKYDRHAIAVHVVQPTSCAGQVGYLNSNEAYKYAPLLDAGKLLGCTLESMGAESNTKHIGLRVFLRFQDGDAPPADPPMAAYPPPPPTVSAPPPTEPSIGTQFSPGSLYSF